MTRWVLVTGGSKNLGRELCLACAKKGYSIAVHYRKSRSEAEQTLRQVEELGGEGVLIQGDFSSHDSLNIFMNRYASLVPKTSVLINNVGNYHVGSALGTSFEVWEDLFQTNLHAPFFLSRALSNQLEHVINIGFSLISTQANVYCSGYHIAKTGLEMLTKSLAKELAPRGVRANMVSPGHLEVSSDPKDGIRELPMGRSATFSEVTRTVLFLLDSESDYITGQNIAVAGGIGL